MTIEAMNRDRRSTVLAAVIGTVLASYAVFAPPGAGLPLEQVAHVHPALATVA